MNFEERLKQLRENTHRSQKETAVALGITTRQYQRFESGEQRPGYDNLIRIADYFHVSLDWLTGREDES